MMKEVEIKYRVKSFRDLRNKLEEQGFELTETEEFEDNYYTDKKRLFIKNETCLRLRRRGDKALLTYKPKTVRVAKVKSKTEIETMVEFKEMDSILKRLGFPLAVSFSKKSDEYKKGRLTVSLDVVGGRKYVEIEILTNNPAKAKEKIMDLAAELGLKRIERRNYRDLMIGYDRYKKD